MKKRIYWIILALLSLYSHPCFAHENPEKKYHHTPRFAETNLRPRFHFALDVTNTFSRKSPQARISIEGDLSGHVGLNLQIKTIELIFFGGINLSLDRFWDQPHAKSFLVGMGLTREITEPLHFAVQLAVSWDWYQQHDANGGLWNPSTQIPLQAGLEMNLLEGHHSSLSFQILGGIAPKWTAGEWSLAGICTGALHANL